MAAFNCGKTKKKFSANGTAVGPAIIQDSNVFERASQIANDQCLAKCNVWISSRTCKDTCKRKTSRVEYVSGSVSIAPSGPGKIRVTVIATMRATVNCQS